jgi:hypothetical protein
MRPSAVVIILCAGAAPATGLRAWTSAARLINARIALCIPRTHPIRACSFIGPEERQRLRAAFNAPDAEFDEDDPNNRVINPKPRTRVDPSEADGTAATGGGDQSNTSNQSSSQADNSNLLNGPSLTQQPGPEEAPEPNTLPWLMRDMPLLRVQWVALPGFRHVYRSHEPHYCQMFEQLVTVQGGPSSGVMAASGRFGHLMLSGGSASLGTDAAQLNPEGLVAPIIGALMEVCSLKRLDDGQLVVIAQAVSGACMALHPRPSTVRASNSPAHVLGGPSGLVAAGSSRPRSPPVALMHDGFAFLSTCTHHPRTRSVDSAC